MVCRNNRDRGMKRQKQSVKQEVPVLGMDHHHLEQHWLREPRERERERVSEEFTKEES